MQNSEPASISVSATITTGTTTVPQSNKNTNERRPSWRLRIDNGCKVCVSAYFFNVSNCSDVFNYFFVGLHFVAPVVVETTTTEIQSTF